MLLTFQKIRGTPKIPSRLRHMENRTHANSTKARCLTSHIWLPVHCMIAYIWQDSSVFTLSHQELLSPRTSSWIVLEISSKSECVKISVNDPRKKEHSKDQDMKLTIWEQLCLKRLASTFNLHQTLDNLYELSGFNEEQPLASNATPLDGQYNDG